MRIGIRHLRRLLGRWIEERGLAVVASGSGEAILRSVSVHVARNTDAYVLDVDYRLGSVRAAENTPSLLCWRRRHMDVLGARSFTSEVVRSQGSRAGFADRAILVYPGQDESSKETVVSVKYAWAPQSGDRTDGRHPACLVIPDMLHLPSSRYRTRTALAETRLDLGHQSGADLSVAAVALPVDDSSDESPLLQCALLSGGTEHSVSIAGKSLPVLMSLTAGRRVDPFATVRTIDAISDALSYMAELFGTLPLRRLALVDWADVDGLEEAPLGCVLVLGLADRTRDQPSPAERAMLGLQLAGIWWGVGCRLSGSDARSVELAVRLAVMLCWLRDRQPAAFDRVFRWYQSRAAWRLLLTSQGAQIRLGLALFGRLRDEPDLAHRLRAYTQTCWGLWTPAGEFRQWLAADGLNRGIV